MRAVVQRVNKASVSVGGEIIGEINKGLMVLFAVGKEDNEQDLEYMKDKITGLRIFQDEFEKMNLSLLDIKGELLVVSQFTLYADCRKGKRPGFTDAGLPEDAKRLYLKFIDECRKLGIKVAEGEFGADMDVSLVNQGPVTILIDSKKGF
jgi:D-aminoacyl-tRNA deacylase